MIIYAKSKIVPEDVAICDNCLDSSLLLEEKNLEFYAEQWESGITYDICPDCQTKELDPAVSKKIFREKELTSKFSIKGRAVTNLKG